MEGSSGHNGEPAEERPSFLRRNWRLLKNWLLFGSILGAFVAADYIYFEFINTVLVDLTAALTAWSLTLFGLSARADGSHLWSSICSFEIIGECTAYYPVAIYVSAVGAFPTNLSRKLLGLALGVPAVLLTNQVRLVSLCYIHHWIPQYFDTLHIVVWQSLIIVLTVVIWLLWATMMAGDHESRSA